MRYLFAALVVTAISSLSLAGAACTDDVSGDNFQGARRGLNAYGLYAPGTFELMTDDDQAMIFAALGVEDLARFQDFTLDRIEELGIAWVRLDYYYEPGGFIDFPAYIDELEARDIEVIGCIRPDKPLEDGQQDGFEADLRNLIESHPGIDIWQLDNEPNLGKYSPEEYVDTFFYMEAIVRDACPACGVMLAGASVPYDGETGDRDYYDAVLEGIRARTGSTRPFDFIDLHLYGRAGFYRTMPQLLDDYGKMLSEHGYDPAITTWITECATYTGNPVTPSGYPPQTEDQQAAELFKRFAVAAAADAERIAWNRFYENAGYLGRDNGYFDNTGLIYNGLGSEAEGGVTAGTPKMAYAAYRTLIALTGGYSAVENLAPGQYRYSFDDGRDPLYLLWDEDGSPVTPELSGSLELIDYAGNMTYADAVTPGEMPVFARNA